MIKTYSIKPGQPLTQKQLLEISEARHHPIVFDSDCPELSPSMMRAFKSAAIQRNQKLKA